jgi:hypothetical protein
VRNLSKVAETNKRPSRRRRIRSGDVIILLIIGALVVAAFNFSSAGDFISFLYQPLVGIILLIIIIEFLWLKSSDRTRVYAIEIERLRSLRRKDEALLRETKKLLKQAVQHPETEEEGRPGDWHQKALNLSKDLDERL